MYGIQESVYRRLLKYFSEQCSIERVVLFGSRAKGLETVNSDIDLCIKMKLEGRGRVVLDIEELIGVYACDIVFEDRIAGAIKDQIQRDGIIIYEKLNI